MLCRISWHSVLSFNMLQLKSHVDQAETSLLDLISSPNPNCDNGPIMAHSFRSYRSENYKSI